MASKQHKRREKRPSRTPRVPACPSQAAAPAVSRGPQRRTEADPPRAGWRPWLWGFLLLCGLWALVASVVPQALLRGLVESSLSEAVNAPVTLESLSLNPFTLHITVRGVRVPYLEEEGRPDGALLTIDRLEIRPHFHAFGEDVPVQASLLVSRPVLDISYLGNGAFSFSKLLPADSDTPEHNTLPLFAISDLKLEEGTLLLRDGPVGMVHTVRDVYFHAPLLDSASAGIAPTLTGLINGTRIDVEGRTEPDADTLRTSFVIRTEPLHMENFRRYLAEFTPLKLNGGTVALDMVFALSQPRLGRVTSSLSGTAQVADVEIASPEGVVIGRLRKGRATITDFTLSERRIHLDSMELDGLYLRVARNREGRVDWEGWARGAGATPENIAPETPFVVEGADLVLRNSDFTWIDASLADTRQIEITGVDGRIAEFSTRPGARTAMRLSFGIGGEGVLSVDGEGTLNPPSLRSSLWVDDLPLILLRPVLGDTPLSDVLGRVAVKGDVTFETGQKRPQNGGKAAEWSLAVSNAEASLRALSFGRGNSLSAADRKAGKDAGTPAVRIRALTLGGLHLDTQGRSFSVKTLFVSAPEVRLNASGELAIPGEKAGRDAGTPSSGGKALPDGLLTAALPAAAKAVLEDWKLGIGGVQVSEGRVFLAESRSAGGTAGKTAGGNVPGERGETVLSGLVLETGALSGNLGVPIVFSLRAQEAAASLALQGTARPVPLRLNARLEATDVPLTHVAPLLREATDLTASGTFSAALETLVEERKGSLDLRAEGTLAAREVTLADARTGKTYALLRRLSLDDLRYASREETLEIKAALLDRLRLSVALKPGNKLDMLERVRKHSPSKGASAFRFSVGSLRCQDSAVLFRDEVHGTVSAAQDLELVLGRLSSSGGAEEIALSGQLGGAPFSLSGACNPFSTPPSAKLHFVAKGVDLSGYSAYVQTYLGYPVVQGRLDLESSLSTSGWTFTLDNRIRLEKPVLGPQDTRPGAPDYPVSLGLSLLEDLRGNVTLDLPVSGRFDDAAVQVGGLVGKALGGLLTKVVTSPFALLGGLVGLVTPDDPAVQVIGFPSGETRINPAADARLKGLASALAARPRVAIQLVGMYEPAADARGLKRQRVIGKAQKIGKWRGTPSSEVYERALRQLYRASPAGRKGGSEAVDVMEQRLQSLEIITQKDLEALALARAEQVRVTLLRYAPALAKRVTIAARNGVPDVRGGTAQVELQLR